MCLVSNRAVRSCHPDSATPTACWMLRDSASALYELAGHPHFGGSTPAFLCKDTGKRTTTYSRGLA